MLVARVGPQLERIQAGHFVSVLAPVLENISCESITEEFVKTLWLHGKWTSPLQTCEFLCNDSDEINGGCNLRVNTQGKGRTKIITRLGGATVPKDATIVAF